MFFISLLCFSVAFIGLVWLLDVRRVAQADATARGFGAYFWPLVFLLFGVVFGVWALILLFTGVDTFFGSSIFSYENTFK